MKYFLSRETIEITWGQTVESSTIKVGKVINVGHLLPPVVLRRRLGLRLRLGDDGNLDLDLGLGLREDIRPADHTGGGRSLHKTTGLTQHAARVHPGLQSGA